MTVNAKKKKFKTFFIVHVWVRKKVSILVVASIDLKPISILLILIDLPTSNSQICMIYNNNI